MNIVILSGGSGKRLWPLSNEVRSKQFLKVLKKPDGTYESMLQRIYRQINKTDPHAVITIATSGTQVPLIKNQLGAEVNISVEPCRKDTFAAIALATAYQHDVLRLSLDDVVIVCPVDAMVEDDYFNTFMELEEQAKKDDTKLILLGIEPSYPSEKYGYIIPKSNSHIDSVELFMEKPNIDVAKEYITRGALWNAGVFAYQVQYVLKKAAEMFGTSNYNQLCSSYESIQKISFDYAIVEKETSIKVVRYSGSWNDMGTWNALSNSLNETSIGQVIFGEGCVNTNVISELSLPIVALGLNNLIIVANPDGILVSDKQASEKLKHYVGDICGHPLYEEFEWGSSKVVDTLKSNGKVIKTKHIIIYSGHTFIRSIQSAYSTSLTVIDGKGWCSVDGESIGIFPGFSLLLHPNKEYHFIAAQQAHIIEVHIE
ncbi:MAG: sugar phosphate nucleotidyltransferase [Candidatus Izemoplasmatales bacterium]